MRRGQPAGDPADLVRTGPGRLPHLTQFLMTTVSTAASVSRTGVDTVTGPGSSAGAALSTRAFSRKIRRDEGTAYRLLETVSTQRVRCPAAAIRDSTHPRNRTPARPLGVHGGRPPGRMRVDLMAEAAGGGEKLKPW
jgi:hypothetical protein